MMKPERELALELMKALGWTPMKVGSGKWEFTRPDTGGWHDKITRTQQGLTLLWVADVMVQYGDDPILGEAMQVLKLRCLAEKFPRYFQEQTTNE